MTRVVGTCSTIGSDVCVCVWHDLPAIRTFFFFFLAAAAGVCSWQRFFRSKPGPFSPTPTATKCSASRPPLSAMDCLAIEIPRECLIVFAFVENMLFSTTAVFALSVSVGCPGLFRSSRRAAGRRGRWRPSPPWRRRSRPQRA